MEKYQNTNIEIDLKSSEIGSGLAVNLLVLVWLVGIILFDKGFAYIQLGPFYITELVLVALVLGNLRNLRSYDVVFGSLILFYVCGGILLGRDIFFVIKDLAWMYYLLFLRFFPRNFPPSLTSIVILACWVRVGTIIVSATGLIDPWIFGTKYRDGVVVLFLIGLVALRDRKMKLGYIWVAFFSFVSFLTNYKTLMLVVLLLPFNMALLSPIAAWHSAKKLAWAAIILLVIIYLGGAQLLLEGSVNLLNSLVSLLGSSSEFSTNTALWRAEIWARSLGKLATWNGILFGEFPGQNFMDSKYLGITNFGLSGGDSLGVVRSAHNILVQIVMKTGLIGLIAAGWYYFKVGPESAPILNFLRLMVLTLAMTADILEVPSRGPLFYCLLVILELYSKSRRSVDGRSPFNIHSVKTPNTTAT